MANRLKKEVLACIPDDILTEERLASLYEEFRSALGIVELSDTSVFSHLVSDVRQVYTGENMRLQREIIGLQRDIIGLQRDITSRSHEHEKQLSELREYYESSPQLTTNNEVPKNAIPTVYAEEPSSRGWRAGETLPANTVNIHVGAILNPRRDMLGWDTHEQGKWGWTERYVFKAFKFLEVGTIKITIREMNLAGGVQLSNAFLPASVVPEAWALERVHFFAYESWRPKTEMISVGIAEDPRRCIYVRGDHANKLEGWTEKFVFWVPV